MFFQETPPDTSSYMILGYVVAFVVIVLYVFSLYIRNRNLRQDIVMLEEMDQQAVQVEPKPRKPVPPVTKRRKKK